MAQPFSLRYPLVDGQGNFGSIDGDSAAAMRYTEIRMAKIAHDLLADLDKETVDYAPTMMAVAEQIPVVLPTKVPTCWLMDHQALRWVWPPIFPPHNLTEVIQWLSGPDRKPKSPSMN